MRNNNCFINEIRSKVFSEVAKLGYEGFDRNKVEKLPYEIIPGVVEEVRESIFLERAIVGERIRLAMGLSLRDISEHNLISDGVYESAIPEKYYEPPLINVIKFACNSCPDTHYEVSNLCQHCLAKHCVNICPKKAITLVHGKAEIDQELCIKCGKCYKACSFNAIVKFERPCEKACSMHAIGKDEYGRADIDYDKCVSCGMCQVNCPFGAIVDKSQLFQVVQSIKNGDKLAAIIAPAFWGQFGDETTPGHIKAAMFELGFVELQEVAIGADLTAAEEALEFLTTIPDEKPFLATSCCPAWSEMVRRDFSDIKSCVSDSLTPMVLTARLIKKRQPDYKIVFIGPCTAKKLEASRKSIRSDVDFVLTFEELQGMFDGKGIDLKTIDPVETLCDASAPAIGFAASGGVAKAVVEVIKRIDPLREVNTEAAESLEECRKMLLKAKAGKYNGYLLEGMACPGGCIAGAGTIQPPEKTLKNLTRYMSYAPISNPTESEYLDELRELIEETGNHMPED